MNQHDVMWICNVCGRIIPNSLYMIAKMHGSCECGGQYYWQLDEFILDRDDKIGEPIDIPDEVEQMIIDIIRTTFEEELEKMYRDGYHYGYDKGYDIGKRS